MKLHSSVDLAIFQRALVAKANGWKPGRRAAPLVMLHLVVVILAVMGLTAVFGAFGPPAQAQAGAGSNPSYTFTTIDVPAAGTGMLQGTLGVNNNAIGDITGIYLTAPNVAHGFVRSAATGAITTFDAPDAGTSLNQGTFPVRIELAGNIAGMYADSNNAYHGFLRSPNGAITEFDVPGAPTNISHRGTIALSINPVLQITGFYVDANAVRHGFVRAADGTFTTFDFPGAGTSPTQGTMPLRIVGAGGVVGFYVDGNQVFHGFIRHANGTFIGPIDDPNASTIRGKSIRFGGTVADGFDGLGDIAGIYTDANFVFHSFFINGTGGSGTFTNIDAPGAGTVGLFPGTILTYMDGFGDVTGTYSDANGVAHGFVQLFGSGSIVAPIDAPGASTKGLFAGTVPFSINPSGQLTGAYADANGAFHGFLAASAVAAPSFSPPAGTYPSPLSVTITDATPGAAIYYTTDGTTPTAASTLFVSPIAVNSSETIEAIAVASGLSNSAVAAATYVIEPAITSISPTTAVAGGVAFTLTVNGTGFVSNSTVNFNGNALVTTFVSSTQLRAAVPASDISLAGNFNVTVANPVLAGGSSNAVNFTVLTPQQATQAIINSVNALFSQGVLNGGQDNSLVGQLQQAISLMNAGKNNGAIGNLGSFISEVNDLLNSGVLSAAQAAALDSAAQSVIAALP